MKNIILAALLLLLTACELQLRTPDNDSGTMTGAGNTTVVSSLLPTLRTYSLLVHRRNGYG